MHIAATRTKIWTFSCVGPVVLCIGVLCLLYFQQIVNVFLQKELTLKPGNEFYEYWKTIPIPLHQKIYVFNITNPEEFENGSKPILQELGPYVFEGRWSKEVLGWNDEEGTVTYRDVKEYTFAPKLSSGDQEDMIYTLNGPLLAVINYIEEYPILRWTIGAGLVNTIFESFNETLLVHRTVREILYEGYNETMITELVEIGEPFIDLPLRLVNETFGILHERKHIGDGIFTVKSGINGIEDYTSIQRWNNKSSVDWWKDEYCDEINGTDGVQYTPGVTQNRILQFFNPNLCRSMSLTYERDVTVHGIKTLRFGLPSDALSSGDVNPDNACFCAGHQCHLSGIYSLYSCKKGAPYAFSLPHFLDGEPGLQTAVEGVQPSAEKHKTYVDVEPNTGIVLNGAFRIQLNGVVRRLPDYTVLRNVRESVVPVIWLSEEGVLDTFFANYFKSRVQTPLAFFKAFCIGCIVGGILWIACSVFIAYSIAAKVKSEPVKPSLVIKTLNTAYTSVSLWPPMEDGIKEEQITDKTPL